MADVGVIASDRPVGVLELQGTEDIVEVLYAPILQELTHDILKLGLCHAINQVGKIGCTQSVLIMTIIMTKQKMTR